MDRCLDQRRHRMMDLLCGTEMDQLKAKWIETRMDQMTESTKDDLRV